MHLQLYNPIQHSRSFNSAHLTHSTYPTHQLIHSNKVTQKYQWKQMKEWKMQRWNQLQQQKKEQQKKEQQKKEQQKKEQEQKEQEQKEQQKKEQNKLYKVSDSLNQLWLCLCVNLTCDIIYAVSTNNIYKYDSTWTNVFNEEYVSFSNISCNTTGKNVIISGIKRVKQDSVITERTLVVYYSDDYGISWSLIYSNAIINNYIISIKCTNKPSFLVLSLNGYVYEYSYEYDKSWKQLMCLNSWCSSIISNYKNNLLMISSGYMNGGLYISYNYGITLIKQSTLNFNVLTSSVDSKYVYAIYNSKPTQGIYISSDYGKSWNKTLSINTILTSIYCNNSGKFIVSTSNAFIYVSNNYGVSWFTHETIANDWNSSFINEDGTLIIGTTLNYAKQMSDIYFFSNFNFC
jgi:hypothetical protein